MVPGITFKPISEIRGECCLSVQIFKRGIEAIFWFVKAFLDASKINFLTLSLSDRLSPLRVDRMPKVRSPE